MKKIICLLFVIILTGCHASNFSYELDTLKDKVMSAEIVEVTTLENGNLDINTINLISDENLSIVLSDLSKIEFTVLEGRPTIPEGTCLKLVYESEYELVCESELMKYKNNNDPIYHKDIYEPEGFDELISKYKKEE